MGNDSSYSVSAEDEVDISYLDDNSLDKNRQDSSNLEESSQISHTSGTIQSESSAMPSLSFEAQVDFHNLWILSFFILCSLTLYCFMFFCMH